MGNGRLSVFSCYIEIFMKIMIRLLISLSAYMEVALLEKIIKSLMISCSIISTYRNLKICETQVQ